METIELGKVWVACEFCHTANMFSNQFCANCGGPLDIKLRITVTAEEEEKRLFEEHQQKRNEYYEKHFAEISQWYKVPFELIIHDNEDGSFSHTVKFEEKDTTIYVPFEFKEPFIKKYPRSSTSMQSLVFGLLTSVLFIMISVPLGSNYISDLAIMLEVDYFNIGMFYYLGVALGAITMIWAVIKEW